MQRRANELIHAMGPTGASICHSILLMVRLAQFYLKVSFPLRVELASGVRLRIFPCMVTRWWENLTTV